MFTVLDLPLLIPVISGLCDRFAIKSDQDSALNLSLAKSKEASIVFEMAYINYRGVEQRDLLSIGEVSHTTLRLRA